MIRTLNSCNCDDLVTIIDDAIVMEGQKGETGQRGNRITVGDGDPGEPPADALAGDVYINQANGDFYQVQDQ